MPAIELDKFRSEAEECRHQAGQAKNRSETEEWLRLAEYWMELARGEDVKRGLRA
jgi:hypothetical protein